MKQERENCCWEQVVSLGQEESPRQVIQEEAGLSAGGLGWGEGRGLVSMQETQETRVQSLGGKDPLEEGMTTHSSILA